jgi:AraC-like DNA-binding protein/beta-xylosidase
LLNHFANTEVSINDDDKRINDIIDYIEANYRYSIKLEDVAKELYLSPQYVAKYFKEKTGTTFLKYLNNIRLKYAQRDLINTKNTITKVAMDNGFPNITSFTKVFNEEYNTNPTKYRKNLENKTTYDEINNIDDEVKKSLAKVYNESKLVTNKEVIVDSSKLSLYKKHWAKVINFGSTKNLLNEKICNQLKLLKEELNFENARVVINFEDNEFYELQNAIDFLMDLKIGIWLVLDMSTVDNSKITNLFQDSLHYFVNRYGINNIKNITVELLYSGEDYNEYSLTYIEIDRILAHYGVKEKLMGPGIMLNYNGSNLIEYLKTMINNDVELESITLSIAPYVYKSNGDKGAFDKVTDTNYILNQYKLVTKILSDMGLKLKIHFTQWEDFQGNKNIFNDSCYRGANIVRNIIQCLNKVESLSLITPLDLLLKENSGNGIVGGLAGILCGKGMKKPAYYAYRFFDRIDKYYIDADDNYFVSASSNESFQIICHNCKRLNYKYYTQDIEKLSLEKIYDYFDNDDKLDVIFSIVNIRNSNYLVKIRTINQDIGSVQDEWLRMGYKNTSYVGPEEVKYLNSFSLPQIRSEIINVKNNKLIYRCRLEPNEIKHIHVVYLHK